MTDIAELGRMHHALTRMLAAGLPGAEVVSSGHVLGLRTPVPHPSANGFVVADGDEPSDVLAVVRRLHRVPYIAQLTAGRHPRSRALLRGTGHALAETLPAMVCQPSEIVPVRSPYGLRLDELAPGGTAATVGAATALAAETFEVPVDVMAAPFVDHVLADSKSVAVVGSVCDEVVVTAQGFAFGEAGLLANVATAGAHRQQGYGTVASYRVVQALAGLGCARVWLVSSAPGSSVYRSIGFREVAGWEAWLRFPARVDV